LSIKLSMAFVDVDEEDIKAFLIESYENLELIEHSILNLEQASIDQEILNQIYRALHSIKGNCGFLPFPKLEAIAHAGESLLGALRDGETVITQKITTILLQTVDGIRQLLGTIEATSNEGEADFSTLIQTLNEKSFTSRDLANKYLEQNLEQNLTVKQNGAFHADQTNSAINSVITESTIRVDIGLLDRVMNLVGELVLTRNQVIQLSTALQNSTLTKTCQRLDLVTSELQTGIIKTRMQPINTIWRNFPRLVRDLAIACDKQVHLELEGADTELDRSILEAIKDPLTHLLRNCIDHGIESPAIRSHQGKSPQGYLCLRAFYESGKVNLEISDDGSGIDPEALKQRAQQLQLINAAQAESMSESEALNLMFMPGFSTAEKITNLSGRGMGMDVVRRNLEAINGTIDLQSQLGQGTTFRLKIPLTLAIIPALLVSSGGERFAIAQANLQELVRLEGTETIERSIETLYNVPVYQLRGQILPIVYLNQVLQLRDLTTKTETLNIVVIMADDRRFGLVVDGIEDTQEIVVKPLGKQLKALTMFAGATILGDGKIALILDASGLAQQADVKAALQQSKIAEVSTVDNSAEEQQLILLVEGPDKTRMGIPLNYAARLEKIPVTAIEQLGQKYLVQYRDRILSLIDLHQIFAGRQRQLTQQNDQEELSVVAIDVDADYSVGLIVDNILDIVEDALTIKRNASRPGVKYYATVQGLVTEILDIEAIVQESNFQQTNPYKQAIAS
jgi:two-component system, chemotaxis family, sensor kinase CheA